MAKIILNRTIATSILFLFCWIVLPIENSFAVLVSGSNSSENQKNNQSSGANKAKASGKVTLKLKPKPSAASNSETDYSENKKEKPKSFSDEDEYEMGISRTAHPASAKPDSTSPIVQTVSGPVTIDYSKGRPARILDRGRPKGSSNRATVTGSIRSSNS